MKKFLTISLSIILACFGVAKAQVTGTTSVHVKLVDILALTVNNTDVTSTLTTLQITRME